MLSPYKITNKIGCLLSPLLYNTLRVLVRTIRQYKEIKGVQIAKKRVKLSSFLNNITVYIENPKESNKKKPITIKQ